MHANQVIERYEAPEATFVHKAILINVNRSATEWQSLYAAVRYAWKIDPAKAEKADVVLAVKQGLIIGAFVADRWMQSTIDNFPGTSADQFDRWGFAGHEAPEEIAKLYLRHRVPDSLRGAQNPIRYAGPWSRRRSGAAEIGQRRSGS